MVRKHNENTRNTPNRRINNTHIHSTNPNNLCTNNTRSTTMIPIKEDNITQAYLKIVDTVLKNGHTTHDERGDTMTETLNIVTLIKNPIPSTPIPLPIHQTVQVPRTSFWDNNRLEVYCNEFLSKDKQDFVYTYGNRLRAHFNVDQIDNAIKRLKNCKDTRRAVSVTWDPIIDDYETDAPCLILVDFKIRDGELYTTALWRSHDIYGAWFPNLVGLTYLAQYVAKNTDTRIASITVHSISAHINKNDLKAAEELIKQN